MSSESLPPRDWPAVCRSQKEGVCNGSVVRHARDRSVPKCEFMPPGLSKEINRRPRRNIVHQPGTFSIISSPILSRAYAITQSYAANSAYHGQRNGSLGPKASLHPLGKLGRRITDDVWLHLEDEALMFLESLEIPTERHSSTPRVLSCTY